MYYLACIITIKKYNHKIQHFLNNLTKAQRFVNYVNENYSIFNKWQKFKSTISQYVFSSQGVNSYLLISLFMNSQWYLYYVNKCMLSLQSKLG